MQNKTVKILHRQRIDVIVGSEITLKKAPNSSYGKKRQEEVRKRLKLVLP